jgi:NitT/TauT family transport system substrate-binding protein
MRSTWKGARYGVPLLCAIIVSGTLAACGGGDDTESAPATGSATSSGETMTTIKASVLPALAFATLPVGIEQGLFEKQHLKIDLVKTPSSTVILPQLVSGDADVGGVAYGNIMAAVEKNLPVVAVAPTDLGGTTAEEDPVKIVSLKDSGIDDFKQLAGKRVAVSKLKGLGEAQTRAIAEKDGIDPNSLKFVALAFPDMLTALRNGDVDAAYMVEPFVGLARHTTEINVLASANAETIPGVHQGAMAASRKFVEANPDVIRRFQLAMKESNEYANSHPEAVRKVLPDFLGIPADAAEKVLIPKFGTEWNDAANEQLAKVLLDVGEITKAPDIKSFTPPFDPK